MLRAISFLFLAVAAAPAWLAAQTSPEIARILERLERLERENRDLAAEVRSLRAELGLRPPPATPAPPDAPPVATFADRLEIAERRVEEQAQTKVEAAQKFPIRLTGMALFNAFSNGRDNNDSDYPGVAAPNLYHRSGATFRQSMVGFDFRGPATVAGGRVSGSLFVDLYGGAGTSLNEMMRLRTASLQIEWETRSVMVGLEKPIFNPRDPSSLARVGVSPLTGAGNLWLWIPQVRFEQDVRWTGGGLRGQIGVVQTREVGPLDGAPAGVQVERLRPGLEGRLEWRHHFSEDRRIEVAPGFHVSQTHIGRASLPSRVFSLDWLLAPARFFELTGFFYKGQNVSHFGTGGSRQGYVYTDAAAYAIRTYGGWGQATLKPTERVALHFFTGQMDDRNRDLRRGALGKTVVWGGNVYYYLAPNVIAAFEATQTRSLYLGTSLYRNNHYDLALAYLF
jgi:hypothetical protein